MALDSVKLQVTLCKAGRRFTKIFRKQVNYHTDPPIFNDNIAYADLSDFFYGFPEKIHSNSYILNCFGTLCSFPKEANLDGVESTDMVPKQAAQEFFRKGMWKAIKNLALKLVSKRFPVTFINAFKQSTTSDNGNVFLQAGGKLLKFRGNKFWFEITGTWHSSELRKRGVPLVTERMLLAKSSVVLVCLKRPHKSRNYSSRRLFPKLCATQCQ